MSDLTVAGGGLTGVCASVSASRMGLDVCLIESLPYLGGLATGGLVNPFMTHKTKDGKTKLVAGIFDEIKERLAGYGGIMTNCFDAEIMKKVLADMTEEAGVKVFLNTEISDCTLKEGIFSVITDKGIFESPRLADTTGDGFVSYKLGCKYEGRNKGNTQAATLMFTAEGVDTEEAFLYCREHPEDFLFPKWDRNEDIYRNMEEAWSLAGFYSIIEKHREEARFPGDLLFFLSLPKKGTVTFNQTHISLKNPTDKEEIKKAYAECEKQMIAVMDFAKKYVPGFRNASILKKADILGIREGGRIMGKYVFSAEDVIYSKKHKDCICRLAYPVDVHKSSGEGYSKAEGEKQVPAPKDNDWYEIPFRCLVTEIPNLLTGGKCVSADQGGQGAIRIMPACCAMGQAMGYAMGLSKKHNCPAGDTDPEELLAILRQNKALV